MFETDDYNRFRRAGRQPVELWLKKVMAQKLKTIHQNPIVEDLVFRAEDYVHSSAIEYAGVKGILYIFDE